MSLAKYKTLASLFLLVNLLFVSGAIPNRLIRRNHSNPVSTTARKFEFAGINSVEEVKFNQYMVLIDQTFAGILLKPNWVLTDVECILAGIDGKNMELDAPFKINHEVILSKLEMDYIKDDFHEECIIKGSGLSSYKFYSVEVGRSGDKCPCTTKEERNNIICLTTDNLNYCDKFGSPLICNDHVVGIHTFQINTDCEHREASLSSLNRKCMVQNYYHAYIIISAWKPWIYKYLYHENKMMPFMYKRTTPEVVSSSNHLLTIPLIVYVIINYFCSI